MSKYAILYATTAAAGHGNGLMIWKFNLRFVGISCGGLVRRAGDEGDNGVIR